MKPGTSPDEVIRTIPGWERATWSELSGGRSNRALLLEADGRRAVLKIDKESRSAPLNDRRQESRVQNSAAELGLAGHVLHVSDTVYLVEYLEGRVWQANDLHDTRNLRELAGALQRLHAMPLTGRSFDAPQAARRYLANIDGADTETAKRCVADIEGLPPPANLRCCHNDLVAENIVSAGGLRFLDWEYACDNDPCFDLATVVAQHDLSVEQADFLLKRYFGDDAARWRGHFDQQLELYRRLVWLWEASRP